MSPQHWEPALYPPLAQAARLSGTVLAQITVNRDGALSAELSGATRYFGPAVQSAIARSRLSPVGFAGATFLATYRSELETEERTSIEYINCAVPTRLGNSWLRRVGSYFAAGAKRGA